MKKSELSLTEPYNYSEKVYESEGTVNLSEDFALPEQLDDAKRVVRCEAMLRPGGRYVNGSEVEYEGEVVYSVLYITDVNSIKNAVFKAPYSAKFIMPQQVNELRVTVMPTLDNVSCKLVSVRKMNLRCNVKMQVSAYKEASCEPAFEGESGEEDAQECEKKTCEVPYMKVIQAEKRDCRVSRDVELPSGVGNVKEIISCSVSLRPCEITVMTGRALMKIEARFMCVYTVMNDDDVAYHSIDKKYILENSLDDADMYEEYEGGANIYCKELTVSLNGSGDENQGIEVDFTYDICARFFGNDTCRAISDVYSCDYENTAEMKTLASESFARSIDASAGFNTTVDAPHVCDVISPCACAVLRSVKFDMNEKKMHADADVAVSAITKDSDGRFGTFENIIPVRVSFDSGADIVKGGTVYISESEIALRDGNIVISGSMGFSCQIFEDHENSIIKSISVDHSKERDRSGALPITFYYPDEGENLWDIAKRYATTVDLVRDANELTENENIGKKVLLIPQKRKRPLFSKVIGK